MRVLRPALLLTLLITLLPECPSLNASSEEAPDDADTDTDEESDSAPFMIVLEHHMLEGAGGGDGSELWRCSGSLVSLRTGVTSAECARGRQRGAARRWGARQPRGASGRGPVQELYALAAATAAGLASRRDGERRVARLATAGPQQDDGGNEEGAEFGFLDLAVLELESPFGSGALARPILMATAPHECADVGVCHVVRTLKAVGGHHARLRIVDARLGSDAPCAAGVQHWAAMRERALCLTGPTLCASERGAGVVCGGKLCGVVSRSGRAGDAAKASGLLAPPSPPPPPRCGDTHAAQSVARWRRFLHCAHTLRACGRGSCAELCSEQRLLDDDAEESSPAHTEAPPPRTGAPRTPAPPSGDDSAEDASDTSEHEQPPAPPAPPAPPRHDHRQQVDLAHLADTDNLQHANSPPVVPPTRTRLHPLKYTQQVAAIQQTRHKSPDAAAETALASVEPTRTAWPTSPARAPLARTPRPAVAPPPAPPLAENAGLIRPTPTALAAQRRAQQPPQWSSTERTYQPPQWSSTERAYQPPVYNPPARPPTQLAFLTPSRPPDAAQPATTLPPPLPLTEVTSPRSVRPTPLFEPNRPDFRAGEYGDNAADYGAPVDDGSATSTTTTTTTTDATTPTDSTEVTEPPTEVQAQRRDARPKQFKRKRVIPTASACSVQSCASFITFLLLLLFFSGDSVYL